jgi:hypothetical protein
MLPRLLSVVLLGACATTPAGVCPPVPVAMAPTQAPASPDAAFDTPDPSGDRAFGRGPDGGDFQEAASADEPPLRGFRCEHGFWAKGPWENGQLVVTFTAQGPRDARVELSFPSYAHVFAMVDGEVDDVYGGGHRFRCRRSPRSVFAVSCGPSLGSELAVVVRGNAWGRTVSFRLPWDPSKTAATLPGGPPLPFVAYDAKRQPIGWAITFDRAACRLAPATAAATTTDPR